MNRNPYRNNNSKAFKRLSLKAQKKAHRRSRSKDTIQAKRAVLLPLLLPSFLTFEIAIIDCYNEPFTYLWEALTD